jgi:hypothetical protein
MKIIFRCCLLIVLTVCGCAPTIHTNVPLIWKPTNDVYSITTDLSPLYARKIQLTQFVDKRDVKEEIGKCIEDGANKPVTTTENVAAWSTDQFRKILVQYGISSVEKDADVILNGEILHFYVTEDKTYKGNVGIKITALSKAGDVLWQGVTTGSAKRFGRSYKLENYYEVLSDSYSEAVSNLLKNASFIQALK